MKISTIIKSVSAAALFCASQNYAAVQTATDGNLVGIDHLGRKLPEAGEVPAKREGKTVALFYYLWHGQHGTEGPYDVSKILEKDPDALAHPNSPLWPNPDHVPMLHWGEPLFGYYQSEDEWVLRRHAQMFVDAGIDVLFFDATNGYSYRPVYMKLFKILSELKAQGFKVPQFAFYLSPGTRGSGTCTLTDLWQDLYSHGYFSELWFKWKGKPIVICHDNRPMKKEIRDFFTFRRPTWRTPDIPNTWYWEGNSKQRVARDEKGNPEQIPVSVSCAGSPKGYSVGVSEAYFGEKILSRSFTYEKGGLDKRPNASHYGFFFEEQIQTALREDPPVAFVTQFNEWLVPYLTRKTNTLYEMRHEILLQDQYDIENSRDIEPMRGGYKDAYYFKLISFVRRFKGLDAPAVATEKISDGLKISWADWEKVSPEYVEPLGDTAPRFFKGYDACGIYENKTGRNEFSKIKLALSDDKLFAYAQTAKDITPREPKNWMTLFVKVRANPDKGWNGYQFAINRENADANTAFGEKYENGKWEKIGKAQMKCEGKNLVLSVDRKTLGIENDADAKLEFKWADNIASDDIMDFYVNGDSAPRGRLNYLFEYRPESK